MKKMVSILMSLVLVISLSACGQGKTENASTNDTQADTSGAALTKVSLGMVPWSAFEFSSTTDNSNAFVGNQLDFCTYASAESIAPYSAGADFKIVLLADKSNGCEGLVTTPDIKSAMT